AVLATKCWWHGRAEAGRGPDPGGTQEARLCVAVRLKCRSELPQTSGECSGPGNRDTPRRSGTAPFGPRHATDCTTPERYADLFDSSCISPQRFRGNNKGPKGGTEKPCRRVGRLRQCGGRKDL